VLRRPGGSGLCGVLIERWVEIRAISAPSGLNELCYLITLVPGVRPCTARSRLLRRPSALRLCGVLMSILSGRKRAELARDINDVVSTASLPACSMSSTRR
jgi:hypothetical protein